MNMYDGEMTFKSLISSLNGADHLPKWTAYVCMCVCVFPRFDNHFIWTIFCDAGLKNKDGPMARGLSESLLPVDSTAMSLNLTFTDHAHALQP